MKYCLALIFEDHFGKEIVEYADKICGTEKSLYKLNTQNSPPHITLLQFDLQEEAIKQIVSQIKDTTPDSFSVNLSGITLLPTNNAETRVEISILKSKELSDYQHNLIEIVGAKNILNATGDLYKPHITLCRMENEKFVKDITMPYQLLRKQNVTCKISLCTFNKRYEINSILEAF